MKLIYDGKTKTVYDLENGYYRLYFKDSMTGENGVFDPGACTVGLTIEGAGKAGLALSAHYFRLIEEAGCPTHFVDADVEKGLMTVKPASHFKGSGIEVVLRYKALGSFIRRYGSFIKEGASLNAVIEITLKDDKRGDPLINEEALMALGIFKKGEYKDICDITRRICGIIKDDLAKRGLDLADIKLEFGRGADGRIMLIDEFSGGNMRVFDGDTWLDDPIKFAKRVLGNE